MNKEEVGVIIKSLVVSNKKDFFLENLDYDFKKETGEHIPFERFGYESLVSFLTTIEGIRVETGCYGSLMVKVETENSRHIQNLVRDQRSPNKRKKKRNKSAPGRTENNEKPVANNVRKTNLKSVYKSQGNLALSSPEDSPPSKLAKRSRSSKSRAKPSQSKSLFPLYPTTQDATKDVRGLPFVTLSQKLDEINLDCAELDWESTIVKPREECGGKRKYKGRKVEEITRCVRFQQEAESCNQCNCPVVSGFTLLGDDFFFDFAKEYLQYPVTKNSKSEETIGMVKKRLEISEAISIIHERCYFPDRMIILIGATDILLGKSFNDIAFELYTLIVNMLRVVKHLIICTIPPLFIKNNINRFCTLIKTNELIKCIPKDYNDAIEIIDLYGLFNRGSDDTFKYTDFYTNRSGMPKLNFKGQDWLNKILIHFLY